MTYSYTVMTSMATTTEYHVDSSNPQPTSRALDLDPCSILVSPPTADGVQP